MTTTTIPAAVLLLLRGALFQQIGSIAEDVASLNRTPDQPGEWLEQIACFDRARALLKRVGWVAPVPEQDVEIDLDRHRRAIVDALARDVVEGQRHASTRTIEAFAESVGLDLLHEPEQRITVPEDFLGLLTEALLSDLQDAAQGVENAGLDPDAYPDPLEQFDALRALLDALGWGTVAALDMDPHGDVLRRTLIGRLEMERGFMADAKRSTHGEGDARQHQRAHAYALQLEAFMSEIGLAIPDGAGRTR